MWIKGFEQRADDDLEEEEEQEEKDEEKNDLEKKEEDDDDEKEEEEEEEDEEIANKNSSNFKKIYSEISIKQNNAKINQKLKLYKLKIENVINKLREKYHRDNIIEIKFFESDSSFNIYRRLAMFKHINIFLYPFFIEYQGIYVNEFISMKLNSDVYEDTEKTGTIVSKSNENKNTKKYGAIVSENMPYMGIRSIIKVNPYDTEGIFKALNQISSWNYNKIRYGFDLVSINKNSTEK